MLERFATDTQTMIRPRYGPEIDPSAALGRQVRRLATLLSWTERCRGINSLDALDGELLAIVGRTTLLGRRGVTYRLPSGLWRTISSTSDWAPQLLQRVRQCAIGARAPLVLRARVTDTHLLVPLRLRHVSFGAIYLRADATPDEGTLTFLMMLANIAAAAIRCCDASSRRSAQTRSLRPARAAA